MLNYEELKNIAKIKRLSLANAEKDYLQDILLFSIYSNIGKQLVFKGGTCLYKIYKLNRFSEDLDFTLSGNINTEKISNKIISDLSLLNINAKIKEIDKYKNSIDVKIILNGPLYKGNKETQCFLPLNISTKEKVLLEPLKESFISLYKEIPTFEIFVMQEKEILAEKLRAIFTRNKPRDIYDLWFLLVKKNVPFKLELVNKKFRLYKIKFSHEILQEKINNMKSLWNTDLKNFVFELKDFDIIKKEIFESLSI